MLSCRLNFISKTVTNRSLVNESFRRGSCVLIHAFQMGTLCKSFKKYFFVTLFEEVIWVTIVVLVTVFHVSVLSGLPYTETEEKPTQSYIFNLRKITFL